MSKELEDKNTIITEEFDDGVKYHFHKKCFNLQDEFRDNLVNKIKGEVTYFARTISDFINDRDGRTTDCFNCMNFFQEVR